MNLSCSRIRRGRSSQGQPYTGNALRVLPPGHVPLPCADTSEGVAAPRLRRLATFRGRALASVRTLLAGRGTSHVPRPYPPGSEMFRTRKP